MARKKKKKEKEKKKKTRGENMTTWRFWIALFRSQEAANSSGEAGHNRQAALKQMRKKFISEIININESNKVQTTIFTQCAGICTTYLCPNSI